MVFILMVKPQRINVPERNYIRLLEVRGEGSKNQNHRDFRDSRSHAQFLDMVLSMQHLKTNMLSLKPKESVNSH